jgi:hypothetical protein
VAESPEPLLADLVKPGVQVSYHMGDGSTARASYVAGSIENVEALLQQKRDSGQLLQVDSIDDDEGAGADLYVVVQEIVAVRIQKGFDPVAAAG